MAPQTTFPSGYCAICTKPNTKLCQRCRSVAYCSHDCQSADWPCHKLLCAAFSDPSRRRTSAGEQTADRPSAEHRLGFLLEPEQKHPSLVWVKCTQNKDDETGIAYSAPEVDPFLNPADDDDLKEMFPDVRPLYANRNRPRDRDMDGGCVLEVWVRDNFLSDGSKPNRSLRAAVGKQGKLFHDWRGPLVVLAMSPPTGAPVDPGSYRDVTLRDFRDAVDYLADYGNPQSKVDFSDVLG